MSDAKQRPPELLVDERWDKAVDLTLRRFVYSGAVGCLSALLLFREYASVRASRQHAPTFAQAVQWHQIALCLLLYGRT